MQHGAGSDGGAGNVLHGVLVAHLGLADAEDGLLIAMVDLDIPAPEIFLK